MHTEATMNYYLGLIFASALVTGQVLAFRINENDILPQDRVPELGLNSKFYAFLDNLRVTLRAGNDSLGIPPMEPFSTEFIDFTLNDDLVKGSAEFRNLRIDGLTDYQIDKAEIFILRQNLSIGLTWPRIHAHSDYKFDFVINDHTRAYGDGQFTVTITDLSFESRVKFSVVNGVKIKNMETRITLGGLELEATGIFGDDDASIMICAAISDAAPQLVEDYQAELTKFVNENVTDLANTMLDGMSIQDILEMLN